MKTFSAFDSGVNTSLDLRSTDLAIIGMACRFPGAATPAAFWQNLCASVESIAFFTEQELAVVDPHLTSDPNYVKAAAVLPDIDLFDAAFFGINHKEAALLDPQQRLFLECAWHALEDAGYAPATYDGLIGVYAGAGMNTYLVNNVHPAYGFSPHRTFLESMTDLQVRLGNDGGYISTRVSYKLNLRGPSVNIQTACSTALVAVHAACQSLLAGECDMALAGAVALRVPQKTGHLYQEDMIFSPDGHCRAFDAAAQGTVFGDGGGIVVLKLLEQAVADGDTIHAVIKGSAINNDGAMKVGYTAPSIQGQRTVIAEALAIADVNAATITYLEAHGTATALGDPIEITALTQAFREHTPATGYCALGSVKTNIGHLAEAAGMAGLIKTILALKHKVLPPSLHFTTPNPQIDFDHSPFYVNTKLTAWATRAASPRRAGVSAFGMGGTNAHLILEEAPMIPPVTNVVERPLHLLTLSAKTAPALHALVQHYAAYLTEHPAAPLADLCFTTNAGRQHFAQRVAIVAHSTAQLHSELTALAATNPLTATTGSTFLGQAQERSTSAQGIAFLFTGQGSQYVEMARQLYETSDPERAVFRQTLDACDALLQDGGYLAQSLQSILYPAPGAPSALDETAYTQPALFAVEYALAQLWLSWGIRPDVVLGHSLGEYVAACVAGVFTLEDALRLVAERGRLMQATAAGAMAAVMADEGQVLAVINAHSLTSQVAIAAHNGPQNIVIAGERQAVATVCQALEAQAIKTRRLNVSHAFHSPLMTPILAEFAQVAHGITYTPAQIPLISNLTGQLATADIATPDYWVRHIRQPVRFAESIVTLRQLQHIETLLEIGPTPTLLSMASDIGQGPRSADEAPNEPPWLLLPSLRPGQADWETLLTSLGQLYGQGQAIDWISFGQLYNHRRLSLPTYPFQRQRHWIDAPKERRAGQHNATETEQWRSGMPRAMRYPLLGQRVALAGTPDYYFETQLSPLALDWIADHQVFATTVLPGAAYVELALAAGAVIAPATAFQLQDLQMLRALSFPDQEPQLGQTVLKADGEHGYSFAFYSLTPSPDPTAAASTWQLHATGRLQPQIAASTKPQLDLVTFQNRCRTAVTVADLYQRMAQQGIDYGPSYRTLQKVWRQDTAPAEGASALAFIELSPPLAQELVHYQCHPALLDAALQVIEALLVAGPVTKTFVPVGIERLTFYARPGAQVWSAVQLHNPAPLNNLPLHQADHLTADIYLFATDGSLVAFMAGVKIAAVNRQRMLDRIPASPPLRDQPNEQAWLYQIRWRPQNQPLATAIPPTALEPCTRHWLILADAGGIGQQLRTLFQQQGDTCTLIFQTPVTAPGAQALALDQRDANALQDLVAALAPPPTGVLHLWSLDTPGSSSAIDLTMRLGCESLLYLVQALSRQTVTMPRLWVVTRGAQAVLAEDTLPGLPQAPLWGMAKVVGLEYPDTQVTCIDLVPTPVATSANEEAHLLWREVHAATTAEQIAYRHQTRYVARLGRNEQATPVTSGLPLPEKRPFALTIGARGSLDQLTLAPTTRVKPKHGEVEIWVHAAGLNFRDVLNALDLYPGEPPLGAECAGEIVAIGPGVTNFAVGDPVIAYALGALGEYVTVNAQWVAPKPFNLSFAEAATIPAVFLTAYYALHHVAKLAPGERVLVHAAAGGVGLAACQLARLAGAEVLATASPAKWAALHQHGVQQVMNSRSADFAEPILSATAGYGVDLVLNSLTGGDFIGQSLAALAAQGRFLELSKRGIWTADQMRESRPDVAYHLIDLEQVAQTQPGLLQSMLHHLVALFETGALQPLPQTIFPIQEAIQAFRYMQQAKQIGKIVFTLPATTPPQATPELSRLSLVRDATYLITGGLGGLGLVVARWLVERGARHLVLVSRRGVTPARQAALQTLEELGACITVLQADVADAAQVADVLTQIKRAHPPLRGIIHAAGVVEDGVLQQMTWARFATVLAPKMLGAWHLHKLTHTEPLDFFVLFSSLTSLIGTAGQANYAAANAFLDGLAHHRRAQQLPALSINWGAWATVGMAAERQLESYLAQRGLDLIAPEQGLRLLEQLMVRDPIQIGVAPIAWQRLRTTLPTPSPFFSELLTKDGADKDAAAPQATSGARFQQQWFAATEEERNRLLVALIREQIGKILGQPEAQTVSRTQGFFTLGMDSLAAVELRNYLQTNTGLRLPNTLAFDYPTIDTLAIFLAQKLTLLTTLVAPAGATSNQGQSKASHTNGAADHAAALPQPSRNGHTTHEVSATDNLSNGAMESLDEIAQRLAAQLGLT